MGDIDLGNDVDQRIQNDLDIRLSTHKSHDSHDSESPHNGSSSGEARSTGNDVQDDADVCADDHNHIKEIPRRVEVL